MTHSKTREYKNEQRQKLYGRLYNPGFSPEFRDEIEQQSVDLEDVHKPTGNKSRFKVIVSNHIVEVWEYEEGVQIGKKQPSALAYDEETGEVLNRDVTVELNEQTGEYDRIAAKRNNARRARNELRRLILANFDNNSKFVTLTFRDASVSDVTNVRECNKAFELFIKRLRKKYGNFRYVKVIEFQDANGRGAVHYHMMSDLPYIDSEKLAKIWKHGFIGINRIDHVDNVGAYVMKYMVKDFADQRLAGEKAYTSSKNLARPVTLYGHDAAEIIEKYLAQKKEVFANSYESEYQGQISYKEYNLQR